MILLFLTLCYGGCKHGVSVFKRECSSLTKIILLYNLTNAMVKLRNLFGIRNAKVKLCNLFGISDRSVIARY